jgi:hypothetical protein
MAGVLAELESSEQRAASVEADMEPETLLCVTHLVDLLLPLELVLDGVVLHALH